MYCNILYYTNCGPWSTKFLGCGRISVEQFAVWAQKHVTHYWTSHQPAENGDVHKELLRISAAVITCAILSVYKNTVTELYRTELYTLLLFSSKYQCCTCHHAQCCRDLQASKRVSWAREAFHMATPPSMAPHTTNSRSPLQFSPKCINYTKYS